MSRLRRRVVLGLSAVTVVTLATATPALADKGWHGKPPTDLPKVPLMVGSGGAVSSVDRDASQVGHRRAGEGRQRRRRGGRHGGGAGRHRALQRRHRRRRVLRLLRRQDQEGHHDRRPRDGAEVLHRQGLPVDPATGLPYPSTPWSTPGSRSGRRAPRRCGTRPPRTFGTLEARCSCCKPAEQLAASGFVVDQTFHDQTAANAARFAPVPGHGRGLPARNGAAGRRLDLPEPRHGHGLPRAAHPRGRLALRREARARRSSTRRRHPSTKAGVQRHPRSADPGRPRRRTGPLIKDPITSQYKGFDVYGMPVAELGRHRRRRDPQPHRGVREEDRGQPVAASTSASYLHWFSEASGDGLRRPQPLRR